MKKVGLTLVLCLAVVSFAGCGGGGEETAKQVSPLQAAEREASQPPPSGGRPLEVTIDGYASPENVGVLLADRLGYFADAGLNVDVSDPLTPVNIVSYTLNQPFTISHQPQVIAATDKGVPIVAVGSVLPEPTLALIWLPDSGIESIGDLKGKTVGITGLSFEKDLLQFVLGKAGLTLDDVELKRFDNELVPALVKRRADAILGTWNVEGVQMEARGLDPVIQHVEDLGVPGFEELVVITHRNRLSQDPQSIRAFMSALARGTEAAVEDPRLAAEAIAAAQVDFAHGGYQPKPTVAEVEATLPLLSRTGFMSRAGAARLSDWMHQEGFIRRRLPPSAFSTNGFLPSGS